MENLDVVIRNNRPFLRKSPPPIDFDYKKIMTLALKILISGSHFYFKSDAFAVGFTFGILTKFFTKLEFRFNEINRSIEQNPILFLKSAVMGHIILFPASLNIGALASGFYTGIGIAKFCK